MPFDLTTPLETWRNQLLDLTKRNRLIHCKSGRGGVVPLEHPDPEKLWELLVAKSQPLLFPWQRDLIELPEGDAAGPQGVPAGPSLFEPEAQPEPIDAREILQRCRRSSRLRADHLLTALPDKGLAARLTRLHLNSRESLTEQGVTTLYVAFGFLRWFESPDSTQEIRSPLLLVPVRLERDNIQSPWRLRADEEEVLPNHALAQRMMNDFKLRLPPADDEGADDAAWRTGYLEAVRQCVRHDPRWAVLDEAALGTFSFQKFLIERN